jgi:ribosomal protein L7/L12
MQMSQSPASPRSTPSVTSGSRYTLETVRDFAMAGRTIDAIKAYREVAGVGLKEAKEYVDKLVKNQQPRS